MRPAPFALERYFARYEFSAPYLLSSSDCDGLPMNEVLAMAGDEAAPAVAGAAPQLHRIARPAAAAGGDRRPVRGHRRGRRAGRRSRGADLRRDERPAPARRPRRLHVPGLPVAPRGRTGHRLRRRPLAAARAGDAGASTRPTSRGMLRPGTRMVIVNFPHNPTGALPDGGGVPRGPRRGARGGARVFCDEMYRLLEYDKADRLPSGAGGRRGRRRASRACRRCSAWQGRASAGSSRATPRRWSDCAAFKDYTTICSSAPSEVLALIGLRARAAIIERHRSRILRNLDVLRDLRRAARGAFRAGAAARRQRLPAAGARRRRHRARAGACRAGRRHARPLERLPVRGRARAHRSRAREHARGAGAASSAGSTRRRRGGERVRSHVVACGSRACSLHAGHRAALSSRPRASWLRLHNPVQACARTVSPEQHGVRRRDQLGGLMDEREIVARNEKDLVGSLPRGRAGGHHKAAVRRARPCPRPVGRRRGRARRSVRRR